MRVILRSPIVYRQNIISKPKDLNLDIVQPDFWIFAFVLDFIIYILVKSKQVGAKSSSEVWEDTYTGTMSRCFAHRPG